MALMAAIMAVCAACKRSVGDAPYAAKIGSATYSTLGAAIAAAQDSDVIEIYTVTGPDMVSAINTTAGGLGKKYRLMQDITIPVTTPIGASTTNFTGEFDGNGHNIALNITSGVVIGLDTDAGLFAKLDGGAKVKNLSLTGTVNVTGSTQCVYVGALTGHSNVMVSAVRSSVAVTAANTYTSNDGQLAVGGLAGATGGGAIENCYSTGTVTASSSAMTGNFLVGGIVGFNLIGIVN
jgi:hypothetical protein